jgi:hypothetical protein
MKALIKTINGMFRVCTDNIKTDAKDIEQEKIDNAYNLALANVLNVLKPENNCEHNWYNVPNYDTKKGNWAVCDKCKCWKKLDSEPLIESEIKLSTDEEEIIYSLIKKHINNYYKDDQFFESVKGQLTYVAKAMQEFTQLKDAEIAKLKEMLPKVCNHEFVSSAAYKGAKYCGKCGAYK